MSRNCGKSSRKGDDCEEIASWILSYGDLMTLLLTFFILIASFSTMELIKFRKFMGAMRGASGALLEQNGSSVVPTNVTPFGPPVMTHDVMMQSDALQKLIIEADKHNGTGNGITIERLKEGIRFRISSPILFGSGQAILKSSAFHLFDLMAFIIKRTNCNVRIEGHTDNIPIHTAQFPSNWDLSTARALSVLKYFANVCNVNPRKLIAIGRGEYKPIAPNDSAEHRRQNRRVEIDLSWEDKSGKELLEERNGANYEVTQKADATEKNENYESSKKQ